jgi:hypothetical protein
MKRVKVLLLAMTSALLALNPAECLKPWTVDKNSMQCCARKTCAPSVRGSDSCCQSVSPESGHYLKAAPPASLHAPDSIPVAIAGHTALAPALVSWGQRPIGPSQHPPPLELASLNLPLLI